MKMLKTAIAIIVSVLFVGAVWNFPFRYIYDLPSAVVMTESEWMNASELETVSASESTFGEAGRHVVTTKLFGFIPVRKTVVTVRADREVYLGGDAIGMCFYTDGLIVMGMQDVKTENGGAAPCRDIRIAKGDILTAVDGVKISSCRELKKMLDKTRDKAVELTFLRDGKMIKGTAYPTYDTSKKQYALGLWVRDFASGIGTVTYVDQDGSYGALGHAIRDPEADVLLPVGSGSVYHCSVVGVNKGQRGKPGNLKGVFSAQTAAVGSVRSNTEFGMFGNMKGKSGGTLCDVGTRMGVKPGKATILSNVNGSIDEYEIEIIKASKQSKAKEKSLVLRVTDDRLIGLTGGIVQGMSGSPIIQNGRIVGAVTHVFTNDPTKGFGIYLDWMFQASACS